MTQQTVFYRGVSCLLLLLFPGWISLSLPSFGADLVTVPELGLRIAPGFRITLYADSDMANDIYAMTLDTNGRVVVTSQGYIKTLLDIDNNGRADQSRLFGTTQTGGMGMCFDGHDLYFMGDGFFSVYHDRDANGEADGPPEKISPLRFAEHGGHAIRKGPDGWWYLIGGNETGFNSSNHITLASSPVRSVEAGALLENFADRPGLEVIAHGLRNPYDFDFNWLGDIFTYDSDVESDLFSPCTPNASLPNSAGGHHGWRGWACVKPNRPDYYADAVPVLAPIGRGSPTGVVCYRHQRFPEHYRNGLFILDWTFGKIYFLALNPDGASYRTQPELFLEPIGTQGFAPTDAEVAPDGSLFVSIGGRKTRGGVYRIEYAGPQEETAQAQVQALFGVTEPISALNSILQAPQPLDAWSRARWMLMAQKLGSDTIGHAVLEQQLSPQERVRAIEVLTEMFHGLSTQEARIAARDTVPAIRARVAWSLGRAPCAGFVPILLPLALDQQPLVRRCALEAIADRGTQLNPTNLLQILPANLAHPDGRVRQAAARLAARLPEPVWNKLWTSLAKAPAEARLTTAMAGVWRNPNSELQTNTLDTALSVLRPGSDPALRLQAVRLIMPALGD
jgi:putative membrane-bound dehydrogenase-like protein